MGDLEGWMDEAHLQSVVGSLGYAKELASVKIIKDKVTGLPLKYGFLEFQAHESASSFYQNYNNRTVPGTAKLFKLNWAAYGTAKTTGKSAPQDIQVYVGDLDPAVTEHKLLEFFRAKFPSAYLSKIITDGATKVSKGYGFVKFTNADEASKAIAEMNGQSLLGKALKVSTAFLKPKEEAHEEES